MHDRGTELLVVLAMAFETWFALAFCALHLLPPDLAPARHMMSEYAVGRYGGVMTSAFAALALASLMLLIGLLRQGPVSMTARAAEVPLAIVVGGLTISAIFPMDAPGAPRSRAGEIHDASFLVNVPSSLLAALLLSLSFGADPRWRPARS